MRRMGNSNPEFRIAARTRSRASCTALSARPTTVKAGSPEAMSTSTSMIRPSNPITAQVCVFASTIDTTYLE